MLTVITKADSDEMAEDFIQSPYYAKMKADIQATIEVEGKDPGKKIVYATQYAVPIKKRMACPESPDNLLAKSCIQSASYADFYRDCLCPWVNICYNETSDYRDCWRKLHVEYTFDHLYFVYHHWSNEHELRSSYNA